jgi:hypothetical protein
MVGFGMARLLPSRYWARLGRSLALPGGIRPGSAGASPSREVHLERLAAEPGNLEGVLVATAGEADDKHLA